MIKFINKLIRANEYRSLCEFADFYKIPGPPFYEYIYTNTITNSEICHDSVYWIVNTVGGEFNLNFLIGNVDDVDNCVSEMLLLIDDVIDKLKENNRKVIEECDITLESV